MVKNGQKWSKMVKNGQKWSKMVKNGQKWSKMVKYGQKFSKIAKNGHKGSKMANKGSTIVKNRQKWSKTVKNSQKLLKKCQNWASSKLRPSYETTRPPFVGGKKNGEKNNETLRKAVSRNSKVISISRLFLLKFLLPPPNRTRKETKLVLFRTRNSQRPTPTFANLPPNSNASSIKPIL